MLATLEGLVAVWSQRVAARQGLAADGPATTSQLMTSGSYFMDVHAPEDNIDTVCVAPSLFAPPEERRSEFFDEFVELLRNEPSVTQVHPVHHRPQLQSR